MVDIGMIFISFRLGIFFLFVPRVSRYEFPTGHHDSCENGSHALRAAMGLLACSGSQTCANDGNTAVVHYLVSVAPVHLYAAAYTYVCSQSFSPHADLEFTI